MVDEPFDATKKNGCGKKRRGGGLWRRSTRRKTGICDSLFAQKYKETQRNFGVCAQKRGSLRSAPSEATTQPLKRLWSVDGQRFGDMVEPVAVGCVPAAKPFIPPRGRGAATMRRRPGGGRAEPDDADAQDDLRGGRRLSRGAGGGLCAGIAVEPLRRLGLPGPAQQRQLVPGRPVIARRPAPDPLHRHLLALRVEQGHRAGCRIGPQGHRQRRAESHRAERLRIPVREPRGAAERGLAGVGDLDRHRDQPLGAVPGLCRVLGRQRAKRGARDLFGGQGRGEGQQEKRRQDTAGTHGDRHLTEPHRSWKTGRLRGSHRPGNGKPNVTNVNTGSSR
ncbi:hypothetical protein SDC9_38218 [bioreactor metagenome]|uniref:Uncharacterized protein n=1 Tax=bioreactor metagenome TaxID=1076179 RepID=A0A644VLC0_9ZZZZ